MDEKLYKVVVSWESTHFVWATNVVEAEDIAEEDAGGDVAMHGFSVEFAEEIDETHPEYVAVCVEGR